MFQLLPSAEKEGEREGEEEEEEKKESFFTFGASKDFQAENPSVMSE